MILPLSVGKGSLQPEVEKFSKSNLLDNDSKREDVHAFVVVLVHENLWSHVPIYLYTTIKRQISQGLWEIFIIKYINSLKREDLPLHW